jgi:hypothetical protein
MRIIPRRLSAAFTNNPWRKGSLALVLVLLFLGPFMAVLAAIAFTPGKSVNALGQHFTTRMQSPSLSMSGHAKFILNGQPLQNITLPSAHIYGPMRPQLELPPLVRSDQLGKLSSKNADVRNEAKQEAARSLQAGWISWFWSASVFLFFFALLPLLIFLLLPWFSRRQKWWLSGAYVGLTVAIWLCSAVLAVIGANGITQAHSLVDLVGQSAEKPEIKPAGPLHADVEGIVLGDSRVSRVGGPLIDNPTPDDQACGRSKDALAPILAFALQVKVVNAACPGASTENLFAPQPTHGRVVPAQLSVAKQYPKLKFVVIELGPNDFWWSDQLKLCYGLPECGDRLTDGNYEIQKEQVRLRLGWAMQELHDLPSHPKVVVNLSYSAMNDNAKCLDAKGLDSKKIQRLNSMNDDLNSILTDAAKPYGFPVATATLEKLCAPDGDGNGPDIQGLHDRYPYHPTSIGETRIALSDMALIGTH